MLAAQVATIRIKLIRRAHSKLATTTSSSGRLMEVNFLVFLILFMAALFQGQGAAASPTPEITPVQMKHPQVEVGVSKFSQPQPMMEPIMAQSVQGPQVQVQVQVAPLGSKQVGQVGKLATVRANSAEKLKRGLTNFMNQLNPAPYFVPAGPAVPPHTSVASTSSVSAKSGLQVSADTAAIVNGDPTADVLIKGPTRLSQTRPIGGPLRWGRR